MSASSGNPHRGGIVHTYQKYDPGKFPSPSEPPPDLVSPVFEHMLQFGSMREFSEEEIANAIKLDPGQFAGLGPSLDQLLKMLEHANPTSASVSVPVKNHTRRCRTVY